MSRSNIRNVAWVAVAVALAACGGPSTTSTAVSSGEVLSALEQQIVALETEAARVQDVSDIKRLQRAYGYYLDAGQWDQMADLFVDSGSIEIGLDGVYVGKDRVREYLHALGNQHTGLAYGQLNEHMELQPVIDVSPDGQTAKGRWRALIMAGQYHKSAFWGDGPYENDYVKDNGVWKIQRVHWYQTYMVPYAGGWAHNKDANGGIYVSKSLPPDRAPSERYETWPSVYIPPFHYKNPVAESGDSSTTSVAGAAPQSASASGAIAALQATVEELRRRIVRLEDEDAIENLISMYGYYLDKQQWDLLTDLFAEDGTMEISLRGVYVGRPSIRKALELFGPQNIQPNHLHNHIQVQPVITLADDGVHAFSRSRALSELATFGQVGMWGDGIYANEYVKHNGVWKIAKDHVYTTFFATYDKGWQDARPSAPRVSDKIPPDRPPTELYDTYPKQAVPPFNYRHPVTNAEIEVPANLKVQPNPGARP